MYVSQLRIEGYSSFADSDWIPLVPGINMVIGTNNSGKSALLQAISPILPVNKHRDETRFLEGYLPPQVISLDIRSSMSEFRRRLAQSNITVQVTGNGPTVAAQNDIIEVLSGDGEMILKSESRDGSELTSREPTFPALLGERGPQIHNVSLRSGDLAVGNAGAGQADSLVSVFTNADSSAFFNFTAQRLNIAKSPFSRQVRLSSDAANLPAVLAYLYGNLPNQMDEIASRVREVVPSVAQITVDPTPDGYEILIWPHMSVQRRELAFSLNNCGTGIAQIIAIFCAVVTSRQNVIVVDEINSFLHPDATKRLMGILATEYSSNQYILSSHSSDAISHPSVNQIVIVERDGFDSRVRVVPERDLSQISSALRALGISMTDVLGADGVLWVEGPTEEIALTNLYQRDIGNLPAGVRLSAVASTGDFAKRGASQKSVTDLYAKVTASVAPMALGQRFLLDREKLSDDAVSGIEASTDRRLRLLPRRCLECYTIDLEAISAIISEELGEAIPTGELAQQIASLAVEREMGGTSFFDGNLENVDWLKRVDGARLLKELFMRVTDNRLEFRKTHHTPMLMAKIAPERLTELSSLLRTCVAEIVEADL